MAYDVSSLSRVAAVVPSFLNRTSAIGRAAVGSSAQSMVTPPSLRAVRAASVAAFGLAIGVPDAMEERTPSPEMLPGLKELTAEL